jgi:SAM-dependent methyltransferase
VITNGKRPGSITFRDHYILHDWDDSAALRILQNCSRSLRPGGTILIADQQPDTSRNGGTVMDLYMMVFTGGKERSLAELEQLARQSGLRVSKNTQMSRGNYLTELIHA